MAELPEMFILPLVDPVELDQMKAAILTYVGQHPHSTLVELEDNIQGFKGNDASWCSSDPNIILWHALSNVGVQAISGLFRDRQIVSEPCPLFIYIVDGRWPSLPIAKRRPKKGFKNPHWLPLALALPSHKLDPDVRRIFNQACKDKGIPVPLTEVN